MTIDFDCSLRASADALEITYSLRNLGPFEFGVFNRIRSVGPDGAPIFSADTIYLEIDAGVLRAQKVALPVPRGLQMAARSPPHVSRLMPMGLLTEIVVIPTPVKEMQPYKRALFSGQAVADVPGEFVSAIVSVGVFRVDAGCRLAAENPAHPTVLTAVDAGIAVARQQVLTKTIPLGSPIPARLYRAVPWGPE